ncbi:MAG: carboxypeptidase-like regulatory domain-containing protein [Planctomycetota bacterium]
MSRVWLPLTITVIAVLGVFLFLNQAEPESLSSTPKQKLELAPAQLIESAPTVKLETVSTGAVERVKEEAPKKSNDPRPYATAVEKGGVLITVIDSVTKEPIPLAHVIVVDGAVADLNAFIEQQEWENHTPRLFRRFGQAYKTNEQAQVRIPQPEGFLVLAGETYTHFDFVSGVDVSSGEYTLSIAPMDQCVVQVVDNLGKPVSGVPALLSVQEHNYANPLLFGQSGTNGLVTFPFFRVMREKVDAPVFASLRILSREEVKTPIDLKELSVAPPVLVVPPTGSVEIKVIDENGKPVNEMYFMRLSILDHGITSYPNPDQPPKYERSSLNYGSDRGMVMYTHVETGLNLGIRVSTSNGDLYETAVGLGPKVQGEKVSFVLQPKIRGVLLTGRFLNADGVVGKNLNLRAFFDSSSQPGDDQEGRAVASDKEGRFRVLMRTGFEKGAKRTGQFILNKTKRKPKRGALFDLSFQIPVGEYDLGDVVLDTLPLFAKGIVLDKNGKPIRQAAVQTQIASALSPISGIPNWKINWTLGARTKGNGKFEIRGFTDAGNYRLEVSHPHYSTSTVKLDPGDSKIVVQLHDQVALAGRILVDNDIDLDDISLYLDEANGTTSFGHRIKADGSFSIRGMESENGTLTISSTSTGEVFEFFDNLNFLDPGTATRIANIDLRGRLHYSTITAVDSQGQAISMLYAKAKKSKHARRHSTQPIKLLASNGVIDVQISAEGYRSIQLPHLNQDYDLVLVAGTPIRFHIVNIDQVDPKVGLNLNLVLKSDDPNDSRTSFISLKKDEQGDWVGNAGLEGRYLLQKSLQRTGKRQGGNNVYSVGEAQYFNIDAGEKEQEFDLTLAPRIISFAERLATRED